MIIEKYQTGWFGAIYASTVGILGALSTQYQRKVSTRPAQGQHKETFLHTTSNSATVFWTTFFARYRIDFKIIFLTLLDHQQFQTFRIKFLNTAFSSLTRSHGSLFDLFCLKTELAVMYAITDFEGKCPSNVLSPQL